MLDTRSASSAEDDASAARPVSSAIVGVMFVFNQEFRKENEFVFVFVFVFEFELKESKSSVAF